MKKISILILALALLAGCLGAPRAVQQVNVFNGSAAAGNTYPGATVPFGAVQLSPDTHQTRTSGYAWADGSILGFSHNHLSGTGCPDYGDWLVTPILGGERGPHPFSHSDERAYPGYYRVDFPSGITAEMTSTDRVGVHRYTFKGEGERKIRVDATYGIGWWFRLEDATLSAQGSDSFRGYHRTWGWAHHRDAYVSGVFSEPFLCVEEISPGVLVFSFPEDLREVTLFVGISGVSIESANRNLLAETSGESFDSLRGKAVSRWEKALGSIHVEGGPTDVFYTYFYHTFQAPTIIDDVDGGYRDEKGLNSSVPKGHHFYSTMSIWDTFRSWNPLMTILDHGMVGDIIESMLDDYDCRGELPIWPLASDETLCMIGYHSVSVIADAYLHGIRSFDAEKALQAMIASSNCNDAGTSALYTRYGYAPADFVAQAVSKTLEFAYDDWCIARMAESMGHGDIAQEYYRRAASYRQLFDPATGFMRGRRTDGGWNMPLDPYSGNVEFTEATPWQYRFFAPHDMAGVESLMGGREALAGALDSLFHYRAPGQKSLDKDIQGEMGQYAHGNEPGHQLPWLFYWVGRPSESQKIVRDILTDFYSTSPEGICGNEDCGQMSAWYVLASLGIYPVCPGTGEYLLTAPIFRKGVITLGNGRTLTILADHPSYPYISDVKLNGKSLDRHFVTYGQIMEGGELRFTLSSTPDHSRDDLPSPYSMTDKAFVSPVGIEGDLDLFKGEAKVELLCRTPGAEIRYTLDGSEPSKDSPLYTLPFMVGESCRIWARAFKEGMEPSEPTYRDAHKGYYRPSTTKDMNIFFKMCIFKRLI